MTIEEKAKAYDEALERARKVHRDYKNLFPEYSYSEDIEEIFPELRESEDERMRKLIIDRVRSATEMTEGLRELLLSYLEKQKDISESEAYEILSKKGFVIIERELYNELCDKAEQKEQKHPDGCFTCDEYKKGYEAGRLNGITAGYNKAMKEQKPAATINGELIPTENHSVNIPCRVWSDEDEKDNLDILLSIVDASDLVPYSGGHLKLSDEKKKELKTFIKSLPEKFNISLKQEWSEEDEKMIKSILFVLESYVSQSESASSPSLITTYPTYYKEIDWLKSIRPQPNPKWSKDDEKMLKSVTNDLFCGTDFNMELKFAASKKVNWLKDKLKSLRPNKQD
jgi:hypothetical protein